MKRRTVPQPWRQTTTLLSRPQIAYAFETWPVVRYAQTFKISIRSFFGELAIAVYPMGRFQEGAWGVPRGNAFSENIKGACMYTDAGRPGFAHSVSPVHSFSSAAVVGPAWGPRPLRPGRKGTHPQPSLFYSAHAPGQRIASTPLNGSVRGSAAPFVNRECARVDTVRPTQSEPYRMPPAVRGGCVQEEKGSLWPGMRPDGREGGFVRAGKGGPPLGYWTLG